MTLPSRSLIKTGSGADLAFAVVVLASFFAMFSAIQQASLLEIGLMVVLGVTYLGIGIYGYAYVGRQSSPVWQSIYFGVQVVLGGIIVYLGKGAGFNALLLMPLAGHAVILLAPNRVYPVNLVIVLAYTLAVFAFSHSWAAVWAGLPIFLAGLIFIIVFTQMAVSEERARTEVERLVDELAGANRRLRASALQVEELAIARERNRMAREIHDGLGHYLTTIHIQIQAARAVMGLDVAKAQAALQKAQDQTQEALADVRRSVSALRVLPAENLPLPETIAKLLDSGGEQPKVEFSVQGQPRPLDPEIQLTLYRCVQEGVNNARKHAQATTVWVILDFTLPDQVRLTINDDGVGSGRVEPGGFGLLGLQERVHCLNGSFYTQTNPGQGFQIEIQIPT